MRRSISAALAAWLVVSPLALHASAATAAGSIQGRVTIDGRPVRGVGLSLVDIDSGAVHEAVSNQDGSFDVSVAPGSYVLTNLSQSGLSVGRAPARVVVAAGSVALADVDLLTVPVPGQEGQPAAAAQSEDGTILHDGIDCLIENEFPLVEAQILPMENVARARVYFRSALGSSYYFVEMVPEGGIFTGKLPKPKLEASPITYYVEATTTDFGELSTPEYDATVIPEEEDCDGEVAAIGPPGAVTVFSASTGAALAVPAGFAAGGLAIAGTTIALLAGGAVAAGVAANEILATTTTTTTTSTTTTTTTAPPTTTTTTTTTTLPQAPPPTTLPPVTPFRGDLF
jgi:hypothetical protein